MDSARSFNSKLAYTTAITTPLFNSTTTTISLPILSKETYWIAPIVVAGFVAGVCVVTVLVFCCWETISEVFRKRRFIRSLNQNMDEEAPNSYDSADYKLSEKHRRSSNPEGILISRGGKFGSSVLEGYQKFENRPSTQRRHSTEKKRGGGKREKAASLSVAEHHKSERVRARQRMLHELKATSPLPGQNQTASHGQAAHRKHGVDNAAAVTWRKRTHSDSAAMHYAKNNPNVRTDQIPDDRSFTGDGDDAFSRPRAIDHRLSGSDIKVLAKQPANDLVGIIIQKRCELRQARGESTSSAETGADNNKASRELDVTDLHEHRTSSQKHRRSRSNDYALSDFHSQDSVVYKQQRMRDDFDEFCDRRKHDRLSPVKQQHKEMSAAARESRHRKPTDVASPFEQDVTDFGRSARRQDNRVERKPERRPSADSAAAVRVQRCSSSDEDLGEHSTRRTVTKRTDRSPTSRRHPDASPPRSSAVAAAVAKARAPYVRGHHRNASNGSRQYMLSEYMS